MVVWVPGNLSSISSRDSSSSYRCGPNGFFSSFLFDTLDKKREGDRLELETIAFYSTRTDLTLKISGIEQREQLFPFLIAFPWTL